MLILLNPYACSGKSMKKWARLDRSLKLRGVDYKMSVLMNNKTSLGLILSEFERGEREFVSAGGDGTLNYLLNLFISGFPSELLAEISLGAIGLGSSNDYHKPLNGEARDSIPTKFNFLSAAERDIGFLKPEKGMGDTTKYFAINASIGITAKANYLFNYPGCFLNWLKKRNTLLSIYYAAIKTILFYSQPRVKIEWGCANNMEVDLTNLAIAKNPYFSGNLSYNFSADYNDGYLTVNLMENFTKLNLIYQLWALSKKQNKPKDNIRSWKTRNISVESDSPLFVEYDGEVLVTKAVTFGILKSKLKLCAS